MSGFVVDSYCNNDCYHYCLIVKNIVEIIYEGVKFSKPRDTIIVYFDIVTLQKKHLRSSRRCHKLSICMVCCCVIIWYHRQSALLWCWQRSLFPGSIFHYYEHHLLLDNAFILHSLTESALVYSTLVLPMFFISLVITTTWCRSLVHWWSPPSLYTFVARLNFIIGHLS